MQAKADQERDRDRPSRANPLFIPLNDIPIHLCLFHWVGREGGSAD